jgi:hypothetical protein
MGDEANYHLQNLLDPKSKQKVILRFGFISFKEMVVICVTHMKEDI